MDDVFVPELLGSARVGLDNIDNYSDYYDADFNATGMARSEKYLAG